MTRPWPWGAIAASVAGIAILATLGVWQVQRLQWKEALIAEIESRSAAPPVSLAEAIARADRNEDIDFLNVEEKGAFDPGRSLFMIGSAGGEPGWTVIAPFVSDDGAIVLVDRGVIRARERDGYSGRAGREPAVLKGQASWHADSRNLFTPDNDAAGNNWYWWDIPAMLGAIAVPADAKVAAFAIHATPGGESAGGPKPQPLAANLRNNHLGYAITWFGLAAALAVIAFIFIRRRMS
jgi:surfeit locus 1 family protein